MRGEIAQERLGKTHMQKALDKPKVIIRMRSVLVLQLETYHMPKASAQQLAIILMQMDLEQRHPAWHHIHMGIILRLQRGPAVQRGIERWQQTKIHMPVDMRMQIWWEVDLLATPPARLLWLGMAQAAENPMHSR